MPSQFIRLTCYGANARANRKRHENAFDILAEADRQRGLAPHIRNPQSPTLLHGELIGKLENMLTEFVAVARGGRGSRLRRDSAVLYAIVISYPLLWRDFESKEAYGKYESWRTAVLEWLKRKFGVHLKSVVEHRDETYPHLHAFVIPPLCPRNRIDHCLHPGRASRQAELRAGGDHVAAERAYRRGMRGFQDDFYQAVSRHFSQDRIGPRRRRFRRDAALVRQSADLFLKRIEWIAAELVNRLETSTSVATREECEDIKTMAVLFSDTRQRLLSGRFDGFERLVKELGSLADSADEEGASDQMNPGNTFESHLEPVGGEADDDLRPEDFETLDVPDDDPDPEADNDADADWEWRAEVEGDFETLGDSHDVVR